MVKSVSMEMEERNLHFADGVIRRVRVLLRR
jgi:hypothetical protein